MSIALDNISQEEKRLVSSRIHAQVLLYPCIFALGNLAEMLLKNTSVQYIALPPTRTKDKKAIEKALINCRRYLITKGYYSYEYPYPRDPSAV